MRKTVMPPISNRIVALFPAPGLARMALKGDRRLRKYGG
jgi:hypothetical protein